MEEVLQQAELQDRPTRRQLLLPAGLGQLLEAADERAEVSRVSPVRVAAASQTLHFAGTARVQTKG